MISTKTKDRQLTSQANASMRLLKRLAANLDRQLIQEKHPIVSRFDILTVVFNAEAMSEAAHHLCFAMGFTDGENTSAVVDLFTSPDGAALARHANKLTRELDRLVKRWDEHKQHDRAQLESGEPTALSMRQRAVDEQFTALMRQAESHESYLRALYFIHHLQFWVKEGKLNYAGQPRVAAAQSVVAVDAVAAVDKPEANTP